MPTGAANANHTVPPRENFDEKYAIVAERNIFLRDRVRRPPPGMNDGPHNEPPPRGRATNQWGWVFTEASCGDERKKL